MNVSPEKQDNGAFDQTLDPVQEAEIDDLLAEANGDARAALRALLHDFEALLRDALAATSRGYTRGRFVRIVKE